MLRLREKSQRQFQNLIGPAQLLDLALERRDTLALSGGNAVTCDLVYFSTLDPFEKRLRTGPILGAINSMVAHWDE